MGHLARMQTLPSFENNLSRIHLSVVIFTPTAMEAVKFYLRMHVVNLLAYFQLVSFTEGKQKH